jgi:uncharacterized membrane protein YccC
MRFFTEYGGYFSIAVVVIAVAFLVWKAWEYRTERNNLSKAIKTNNTN